jgi:hypothetical protein
MYFSYVIFYMVIQNYLMYDRYQTFPICFVLKKEVKSCCISFSTSTFQYVVLKKKRSHIALVLAACT